MLIDCITNQRMVRRIERPSVQSFSFLNLMLNLRNTQSLNISTLNLLHPTQHLNTQLSASSSAMAGTQVVPVFLTAKFNDQESRQLEDLLYKPSRGAPGEYKKFNSIQFFEPSRATMNWISRSLQHAGKENRFWTLPKNFGQPSKSQEKVESSW